MMSALQASKEIAKHPDSTQSHSSASACCLCCSFDSICRQPCRGSRILRRSEAQNRARMAYATLKKMECPCGRSNVAERAPFMSSTVKEETCRCPPGSRLLFCYQMRQTPASPCSRCGLPAHSTYQIRDFRLAKPNSKQVWHTNLRPGCAKALRSSPLPLPQRL